MSAYLPSFLFSVNDNGATLLESQRNRVIVLSPN